MKINELFIKSKNKFFRKLSKFCKNINVIRCLLPELLRKKDCVASDLSISENIKLYYYKLNEDGYENDKKVENLGDYLSKVVVSHFVPSDKVKSKSKKTLYAIGSIIGFRCQDATIWGSGLIGINDIMKFRIRYSSLDIRAVRGPKTRELLKKIGKNCPEIYGDPAVLMPFVFEPVIQKREYDVSLILHYKFNDFSIPNSKKINTINILTTDYKDFITQIVKSSLVISSSLHGIILAETYGVPAILLLKENYITFKYEDWYYSTGRHDIVIAHSIQEALNTEPMPLPDLTSMQERLIKAFPTDLFN